MDEASLETNIVPEIISVGIAVQRKTQKRDGKLD